MTITCAESINASFFAFPSNLGVSSEAEELEKQTIDLQEILTESIIIGKHYKEVLMYLFEAFNEYSFDNWDGYGAKAVDPFSCSKAIHFSKQLPMNIPIPEIQIDTDGEVRFEWYRSPRQVFSITVRPNGELAYAGLFGASKTHGTEYLDDELPSVVLDNIYRVYSRRGHHATTWSS
jgi:hypothetical protein